MSTDRFITLASDCAAGAFARLHKPNSKAQTRSPTATVAVVRHVKTSLSKQKPFSVFLPAELLLNIFQFVYALSIQTPESPNSKCFTEWQNEDPLSPSLFPYAIASVCSFWRNVMLMTPAFWTRIVILVDALSTPLSMIECQLARTRDLPLDITITRRVASRTVDSDGPHEKKRVDSVMAIIAPQLHRCQKLRIDVSLSSSLPSFPSNFRGDAPLLEELLLECDIDDGNSEQAPASPETQKMTPFWCPVLRKLALDGRNFYNACEEEDWTDFRGVTDFAISRLTDSLPIENILSAVSAMSRLADLRITDVVLDSPLHTYHPFIFRPSLSLVCEDLGDVNCLIDRIRDIVELTLTRCAIGHVTSQSTVLILNDNKDRLDEFGGLLRSWHGRDLYIQNCSDFDDRSLEWMWTTRTENGPIARRMKFLGISNCLNFSVRKLKRYVMFRQWARGCTALEGMRVSGDSPYFSPEDILWFEEHLDYFIFTPIWYVDDQSGNV